MPKYDIKIPAGFDPKTQKIVGWFTAQLDGHLKQLKNNVKGLTVKQLEWQKSPRMNTIGMLLAHMAQVEVWWIKVAPKEIEWGSEAKNLILKYSGYKDDGLAFTNDGRHAKALRGYSLSKYMALFDKVRRSIRNDIKKWQDKDLDKIYRLGKYQFSRGWTLGYLLEHFTTHFGQIQLVKHMMRNDGILKETKK